MRQNKTTLIMAGVLFPAIIIMILVHTYAMDEHFPFRFLLFLDSE